MNLRLIILLAAASLASTPAFATHGNPKDFYAVQRYAPKQAAGTDTTGAVAPKPTGHGHKHHR